MLEQLLPVALILLVLLLRPFLADLLRTGQRAASPEGEPEALIVLPKAPLRPSPFRVNPSTPHKDPRGASLPEKPPGVIRRQAHARVRSLRDVRRGIVLMTILGPCRALESPRPLQ